MHHTLSRVTKGRASQRYQQAHRLWEEKRGVARDVRRKLVAAIHCHGKDILSLADLLHTLEEFNRFLGAQLELQVAAEEEQKARTVLLQ